MIWVLYHKTNYGRKSQRAIVSWCVSYCQSLLPKSTICEQVNSLPEWTPLQDSTSKVGRQTKETQESNVKETKA